MARELSLLVPKFRALYEEVLEACAERGYEFRTFFTLRTPWEQAKYWRQSRSKWEIEQEIKRLLRVGAWWIASVIKEVGPQHGRWATNAVPGLSWHQWGEAADSFLLEGGRAVWSEKHPGYVVLAQEGRKRGLKVGADFGDMVHLQLRDARVQENYDWPSLDAELKRRFMEEKNHG